MSQFSEIDKVLCNPTGSMEPEKICESPQESPPEDVPWYDEKTQRYYVNQFFGTDDTFIPSLIYSLKETDFVLPSIVDAAKDRIIKYFSLDVTEEEKNKAEFVLEKTKVYEMPQRPVKFTISVKSSDLNKRQKLKQKPQLQTITIDGKQFFPMLEKMLNKMKTYSKFQSLLFAFDKIKITKLDNKPFYLRLVSERLKNFIREIKKLFEKNKVNINNLGDIIFYIEVDGLNKTIKDITINNSKILCQDNELAIGMEEFLESNFLKDSDLVSFVLNVVEIMNNPEISWIDILIKYGAGLKIANFLPDVTKNIPCFLDFNPEADAVLDFDLSFHEKLEFSFQKKNSVLLRDVMIPPKIMKPATANQSNKIDELLDSNFKMSKNNIKQMEGIDHDNPFDMFLESIPDFSFEEFKFDKVYQFLGPSSFSLLLNRLLSDFQKMSNPFEMFQNTISVFIDSLQYDAFIKMINKLPLDTRNNFLIKIKNNFSSLKPKPKEETKQTNNIEEAALEQPNYSQEFTNQGYEERIRQYLGDRATEEEIQRLVSLYGPQSQTTNITIPEENNVLEIDNTEENNVVENTEMPEENKTDEEFILQFPEILKKAELSSVKEQFKKIFEESPEIDVFSDIPEFSKIAQVLETTNVPGIEIAKPLDFLSGFKSEFTIFHEKFLKLPKLPKLPEFKFSITKLIQDNLFSIIKKIAGKIIAIVIQKIAQFIKNATQNGLSNSLPIVDGGDFRVTNGLSDFVKSNLCKAPPYEPNISNPNMRNDGDEATDALLKTLLPSNSISDKEYIDLAVAIGSSSSMLDIINAVAEDDMNKKQKYLENLTEVIRTTNPEFSDYFKDIEDTASMFTKMRNYMSPETLAGLTDFAERFQEDPEVLNYCITKERQEEWAREKTQGLLDTGYAPEAAQKAADDVIDEISDNTSDILDFILNGPFPKLSDKIEDIIKQISDGKSECDDLFASEETKETIKEQKEKQNSTQDLMLEKINSVFVEDLIEDKDSSIFNNKGILSRIMSDKYGRSLSQINNLKNNFLTSFLLNIGILPPIEFADTIGEKVTSKLSEPMTYIKQTEMINYSNQVEKPFSNFFKNITIFEPERKIKNSDLIIAQPENVDGISVEYIDYDLDEKRYFLKVGQEMIIDSRIFVPNNILSSFPELRNIPKSKFIQNLLTRNLYTSWDNDNKLIFSLVNQMELAEKINFNYPPQVTKQVIEDLQTEYEKEFDLNVKLEGYEHLEILDPETYGTAFGKIKIHASNKNLPDGFFKDSIDFYDKKTDVKLDRTILNLNSVKKFIDEYSQKLDKAKFADTSPECLSDMPLYKVADNKELASAQGMIKSYVRIFLAEYMILANNVFKSVGFEINETTMASYILENIKREIKTIKIPSKSIYNNFVIYVLMLMSNGEAYLTLNDDVLSTNLNSINQNFEALKKDEIKYLKQNSISRADNRFRNYLLGFYGIAFEDKYKILFNSTTFVPPFISSKGMTSVEIRFANKLGHGLDNIEILEEAFLRTIENEIKEYKALYPYKNNIYSEFLKALTEEEQNFVLERQPNRVGWSTNAFYKIKQKEKQEKIITKDDLLIVLETLTQANKEKYISQIFGDAVLDNENKTYKGTIGIKYGVSLYYNGEMISTFYEDIKDVKIISLINDLKNNSNFNSSIYDHQCYVDNFFKTKRSVVIFDLAFQIKKLPTMLAIYYIENLTPSINKGQNEAETAPFNPSGLFANPLSFLDGLFGRTTNFLETKKEIKRMFLSNYIREFYDPSSNEDENFLDFKNIETIKNSIDLKNFSTDFLTGPTFFQKTRFLDNISLDENGEPIVNKFLSVFK